MLKFSIREIDDIINGSAIQIIQLLSIYIVTSFIYQQYPTNERPYRSKNKGKGLYYRNRLSIIRGHPP